MNITTVLLTVHVIVENIVTNGGPDGLKFHLVAGDVVCQPVWHM
jgi:hypothetical protein